MNYDLGQVLYVINDDGYMTEGKIESIKTTTYKSYVHGFSKFKQYHINGTWYYLDRCFAIKEDAIIFADRLVALKIEALQNRLSVNKM